MIYECIKCNKIFKQKSGLTDHNKRKRPCIQITDININPPNIPQSPQNIPQSPPNSPQILQKKYCCSFCKNQFTRSDHLKRHLDRCKVRKSECLEKDNIFKVLLEQNNILISTIDIQKDQLDIQKDQINKLIKVNENLVEQIKLTKKSKKHVETNINNINNQNYGIINNIKIIQFGKEDLSILDNKSFFDALNTIGYNIPAKVIEGIHINSDHPEFKNIYISDINREKAMIFNGKNWILQKFDNISDTLLDKTISFMEDRYEQLKKSNMIPKNNINFIDKRLKTLDKIRDFNSDDEDELGNILNNREKERRKNMRLSSKREIKLKLYNKRNEIIKNINDDL